MKLFCDMDGVLVRQTAREGFDAMPWTPDGRELWAFLEPHRPTILSMLPRGNYERCAPEKLIWCRRELGLEVPVVIVSDDVGKSGYAAGGAVLIDDGLERHGREWTARGGRFVHHVSAARSIEQVKALLSAVVA